MHARSHEVSLLQSSRAQPQTETVMNEHLQAVRSAVQKHIGMMRTRLTEHLDHARDRRVYSGSHVQRLNGNPCDIDTDHFMSARSISAHSRACDAGHRRLNRFAPSRSSIWIWLSIGLEERDTGTKSPASVAAALGSADRIAHGARPRSASCTQRRNRLAFNPRARATAATDAPGCWQAPTASALKNTLWRRRRRRPLVTTSSVVSTCPPNPLVKRGLSFLTPGGVGKVCWLAGYIP